MSEMISEGNSACSRRITVTWARNSDSHAATAVVRFDTVPPLVAPTIGNAGLVALSPVRVARNEGVADPVLETGEGRS
ncbi:hypothetical protein GCM10025877_19250 [Agromyces mangrovi Wang et al. 2018]|nr:hypothetical protein GCM10025877_19250 [Agromyces mangrovi]